jgi:uncharacterized protein (TIGR03437 family)
MVSMSLRVLAFLVFSAAAFAQTPTVTAVVNAASYGTQLCPGLEVTIYGSNLGTSTPNVSVTVGGVSGYIIPGSASNSQVGAQLPFNIPTGPTTLTVSVLSGGSTLISTPFNVTISAVSPYFATQSAAGSGPGSFLENSTGKQVTLATPANPGDNLVGVAVGLGPTSPASPIGPATATNSVPTLPAVTVGGVNANVTFAGITPGAIGDGLYQVNFAVPSGLQGTQNVVMSLDGVTSTSVAAPQVTSPVTLPLAGLSSIVNSGSFAAPGTASPGSIVTAFANSLGTTTNVESGLFPATSSEGIQITFNGAAAPLLNVIASTAQQQVDLVVPSNLPTSGTVNVQLTTSTALYPNYTLNMVPANPGFFAFTDPKMTTRRNVVAEFNNTEWLAMPVSTAANLGFPACTSSTGRLTPCGEPATIGDYLSLYLTGLGLATPNGDPNGTPLPTGSIPPANGVPLYETPTKPVVTIGGIQANVLFSGLVPGVAGEYQIDIQVPSGVTNGDDIPVVVTILGASDSSTTISIQPGSITPPTS